MSIKWTSMTQYVDLNTGEVLTKRQVKEHYTIIHKTKKIKYYEATAKSPGTGYITWINECKPTNQRKLFEDTNERTDRGKRTETKRKRR